MLLYCVLYQGSSTKHIELFFPPENGLYKAFCYFIIMTVVTTLAFLICIILVHIFKAVVVVTGRRNSLHTNVTLLWLKLTVHNLSVVKSATNFFLYIMTGSK